MTAPFLFSAFLLGCLTTVTPFNFNIGGTSRFRSILRYVRSEESSSSLQIMPGDNMCGHTTSRRQVMHQLIASTALPFVELPAEAIVTDETATFASPSLDDAYKQQSLDNFAAPNAPTKAMAPSLPSDEVSFTITKSDLQKMQGGLGLELGEVSFRTNFRVIVKSVAPNSLAERLGIQPSWVVVSVNGADAERTNAAGVAIYFSRAVKSVLDSPDSANAGLTLTFRDPARFRTELQNFPGNNLSGSGELPTVSTKVAPAGDTTQRFEDGSLRPGATVTEQSDQVITITQLIPPKLCQRRATTDDLLEISYIGKVVETGAIFDGSAVKINGEVIPGRGNDVSVFFVLGKQPFGQFPPGWDVGLQGMCVGERRRLVIPPVLAYGATGVPRRGIPPNATLQYDITLVSLNGLAIPQ
ncbi:hypothetical protein ACHAW6_015661 [Cyclotella cf. meneghiniana]